MLAEESTSTPLYDSANSHVDIATKLVMARELYALLESRDQTNTADGRKLAAFIDSHTARQGAPDQDWDPRDFRMALDDAEEKQATALRSGDVGGATRAKLRLNELNIGLEAAKIIWARRPALLAVEAERRAAAERERREENERQTAALTAAAGALADVIERFYLLLVTDPKPSVAVLGKAFHVTAERQRAGAPHVVMTIVDSLRRAQI